MVKMVSLKRTKGEREATDRALGQPDKEPDGIDIHLEHHHLEKLGAEDGFEKGHKVKIHAHGLVASTSEHDGRRSMRVRITHMGMEHRDEREEEQGPDTNDESKRGIREELTRAHGESEARATERAKAKEARGGKKVPEKADGK